MESPSSFRSDFKVPVNPVNPNTAACPKPCCTGLLVLKLTLVGFVFTAAFDAMLGELKQLNRHSCAMSVSPGSFGTD